MSEQERTSSCSSVNKGVGALRSLGCGRTFYFIGWPRIKTPRNAKPRTSRTFLSCEGSRCRFSPLPQTSKVYLESCWKTFGVCCLDWNELEIIQAFVYPSVQSLLPPSALSQQHPCCRLDFSNVKPYFPTNVQFSGGEKKITPSHHNAEAVLRGKGPGQPQRQQKWGPDSIPKALSQHARVVRGGGPAAGTSCSSSSSSCPDWKWLWKTSLFQMS